MRRRLVVALMAIAGVAVVVLVVVGGLFAFFPMVASSIFPFAAPPHHFTVDNIILGNRGSDNLTVGATITNDDASIPLTRVTVYASANYFLGMCDTGGNGVQPKNSFSCSVKRKVSCRTQSVGAPRPPLNLKFVAMFSDGRTTQSTFQVNPTTLRCAP